MSNDPCPKMDANAAREFALRIPAGSPANLTLAQLVAIADRGYGEAGNIACFLTKSGLTLASKKHRESFGDTLAEFIAVELAETFSNRDTRQQQLLEALRVMRLAQRQIEGVYRALEEAANV